jgi:quinol monooxygenase YgiN
LLAPVEQFWLEFCLNFCVCNLTGVFSIKANGLPEEIFMVKFALLVLLEAKAGKEEAAAAFLKSALPLVQAEPATTTWFGIQIGASTFGIFDAFPDEAGRNAHLSGKVAAALMEKAPELFKDAPKIQYVDVLAAKLP